MISDLRREATPAPAARQRVALARALIVNPRLLLFDEPLSNLDAKLREEIVRVQREVGITAIYVTHDQAEAIVISDQSPVESVIRAYRSS